MDPATPVDAIHLDPDTEPAAPLPPAPEPPPSAADQMRAVEHRLAVARNRMMRRLVEVSRRVDHAREKMDVGRIIGDHALAAVGIAAGAGALLALPGKRGSGKRTVPARMGGLVGALAFALVKDGLSTWLKRSITHAVQQAGPASRPAMGSPVASSAGPLATAPVSPAEAATPVGARSTSTSSGTTTLRDLPPIAR